MRNLLSIFFICYGLSGAAQHVSFRQYTPEHGFPEVSVNTLCEDKRGNLWIGTASGLFVFDGYTFRAFTADDGLVSENILSLFEDREGKLWIGTDKGVSVHDGIRFSIMPFLRGESVVQLLQDKAGQILICTRSNGLFQFNGSTLTSFAAPASTENTFRTLFLDDDQSILTGSNRGLTRFSKGDITPFTRAIGLPSNEVLVIARGADQKIWIGTKNGLCFYQNGMIHQPPGILRLPDQEILAIASDQNGNLWFGTPDGILMFDGTKINSYNPYSGQGKNHITSILADRSGNLWFGSAERGLSRLEIDHFVHYAPNDRLGKKIYSVVEALNGNLICGTSLGGTTVFDGKQFSLLDKRGGFTSSIVQALCYGRDSSLWVGTQDDGLFVFKNDYTLHFTTEDGLISNNITAIAFDTQDRSWLATQDQGLMLADLHADTLSSVKNYTVANGLNHNQINTLLTRSNGEVIAGTEDGISLVGISPDSAAITPLPAGDALKGTAVYCLLEREKVFAGTSRGLFIWDGRVMKQFTRSEGLGSNMIYSLTFDNNNNLWAGTDKGVDLITFSADHRSIQVRHFGYQDGFRAGEVFRNASCTDRNGNVWFGTINGLVRYDPKAEMISHSAPRVHLTGMKLFFEDIADTPFGDSLSAWHNLPVELSLPYDQNNVTFSYVGIHHSNPESVRYKWILEGFSKEWSPPVKEREAIFSNLPPGKYTFKVLAANEYNQWTASPAVFSFTLEAPWWQWWWVRILFLSILIGMIWMIFAIRLRQLKARNKILQERLMLEKNVLVLEQEASRLQMNPHFIFNCLNSIQGLISANEGVQAKKYLGKFARLMRLILEHAREEFIPLEKEIQMLENYLELEQVSTGQKFMFSITCEPSVDPTSLEIPPMMIQPFVENAVIHGIKRKDGDGTISIHFSLDGDLLQCEVVDNGIGRVHAAKLKAASRADHKSTAIAVTQQRLAQYGDSRQVAAGISFVDLYDNGQATGTKVVIRTPTS